MKILAFSFICLLVLSAPLCSSSWTEKSDSRSYKAVKNDAPRIDLTENMVDNHYFASILVSLYNEASQEIQYENKDVLPNNTNNRPTESIISDKTAEIRFNEPMPSPRIMPLVKSRDLKRREISKTTPVSYEEINTNKVLDISETGSMKTQYTTNRKPSNQSTTSLQQIHPNNTNLPKSSQQVDTSMPQSTSDLSEKPNEQRFNSRKNLDCLNKKRSGIWKGPFDKLESLKMSAVLKSKGHFTEVYGQGFSYSCKFAIADEKYYTEFSPFVVATGLVKDVSGNKTISNAIRNNFRPLELSNSKPKNKIAEFTEGVGFYGHITTEGELLVRNNPIEDTILIVRNGKTLIFIDEQIPLEQTNGLKLPILKLEDKDLLVWIPGIINGNQKDQLEGIVSSDPNDLYSKLCDLWEFKGAVLVYTSQ